MKKRGFTMIESVIVLAIIGIVLAILWPVARLAMQGPKPALEPTAVTVPAR